MARTRLRGSWVGIAAVVVVYWERQGILRGRGTAVHMYRPLYFLYWVSDWRWAGGRALCEANALARDAGLACFGLARGTIV